MTFLGELLAEGIESLDDPLGGERWSDLLQGKRFTASQNIKKGTGFQSAVVQVVIL
jgi:hypothetical protein